jgi:cytochrome c-type biogenesis protein CcmH/NrfG
MFQRLQRSLRHVLSGLTIAVILTAVPVFSRVSAQVVPPALAPPAAAPPAAAQAPAPTAASRRTDRIEELETVLRFQPRR